MDQVSKKVTTQDQRYAKKKKTAALTAQFSTHRRLWMWSEWVCPLVFRVVNDVRCCSDEGSVRRTYPSLQHTD